jgi:hypothetical protein
MKTGKQRLILTYFDNFDLNVTFDTKLNQILLS